jgi:serine phosphatase RsbU (regulator of sigma subunit)
MKNKLLHTWKKISENGLSDDLDNAEKKSIRILNRIIAINAILAFIFIIIDLSNSSFEAAIISFITFMISPLLFLLIKNKIYNVAKWLILLFIILFISSITILIGNDSGMIVYFIPGVLFPTILFQSKKAVIVLSSFIIGILIAVFIINNIYHPLIIISEKELTFYTLSSLIGCAIITLLIIWHFKSTNSEYEEIILSNNKDLKLYNHEINEQKLKLESKNKDITDSINYASRIQQAILPSNQKIEQYIKNFFIFNLPKDILSGDFYWIEAINKRVYFAVADCTGHGIPGSMVSVVCNNALNRSIQEFNLKAPNEILNKTRELVINAFDDNEKNIRDGMDISLCCIDKTTNKLLFSGANNPLIIIRKNKLITLEADRQPIGKYSFGKPFSQQEFNLIPKDIIYLYTDGFADQFGGDRGKKYKSAQLLKFLLKNSNLTLRNQKDALANEFKNWKSDHEQIDDVCIMGLKI